MIKLCDIVGDLTIENQIMFSLASLSVGEEMSSKYGSVKRITDTEFQIKFNNVTAPEVHKSQKDLMKELFNDQRVS